MYVSSGFASDKGKVPNLSKNPVQDVQKACIYSV
jgi:hypothetical protein